MERRNLSKLLFFPGGFLLVLAVSGCMSASGIPGTGSSRLGAPAGLAGAGLTAGGSAVPKWVRDPYTKYSRQANEAAVGTGGSRELAEKSALGNLVARFGQSIRVDEKVSSSYQEVVNKGVSVGWLDTNAAETVIETSTGLDPLIGADIAEVWYDGRGEYYAVAVLNKAKASEIYSGLVKSNQEMIHRLVDLPPEEKNTLDGLVRCQFAATVADAILPYVDLLSVIGTPVQGYKRGGDYRLEALDIIKAIPVGVRVENDKSGRIRGAFAKALSDLGFLGGGNNSRYVLDVKVVTSVVEIANNSYKWARIEMSADLVDNAAQTVLLPYNFSNREGHTSQSEADNRAYTAAERRINEEYSGYLEDYLSGLLPQ